MVEKCEIAHTSVLTSPKPLIFDIAKGSFTDGPGIRTTVFFKGCPLRCLWCHNPEAQSLSPEVFFYAVDCIKCGNCRSGKRCFTGARREVGRYYDPVDLLPLLLADKAYYETSGGGVTFSGGEPLLFIDYLAHLLPLLKSEGIHITLQTCGYFDYPLFAERILPYLDLVHFDLKLIDPLLHREYTGQSNELILSNLHQLVRTGLSVLPRMPLIPNYTATKENLAGLASLLSDLKLPAAEFLPYNPLGLDKLHLQSRKIPAGLPLTGQDPASIKIWIDFFKNEISHITI